MATTITELQERLDLADKRLDAITTFLQGVRVIRPRNQPMEECKHGFEPGRCADGSPYVYQTEGCRGQECVDRNAAFYALNRDEKTAAANGTKVAEPKRKVPAPTKSVVPGLTKGAAPAKPVEEKKAAPTKGAAPAPAAKTAPPKPAPATKSAPAKPVPAAKKAPAAKAAAPAKTEPAKKAPATKPAADKKPAAAAVKPAPAKKAPAAKGSAPAKKPTPDKKS